MLFKHRMFFGMMFFAADGAGGTGGAGGAGESGGNEGGESGGEGEGESDDKSGGDDTEGLKSALEKERKAARDATKALKAAQAEIDNLKAAGQSDEEKRDAALKDAEERADKATELLRTKNGRMAVLEAKVNAVSNTALYHYIASDIEYDDEGEPTNVDDLIDQAKKDEPSLFQRGSADGAARSSEKTYEPEPGTARMAYAYEQNAKKR